MPHLKALFHSVREGDRSSINGIAPGSAGAAAAATSGEPALFKRATTGLFHSSNAAECPSPPATLPPASSSATKKVKSRDPLTRASSFLLAGHHKNNNNNHEIVGNHKSPPHPAAKPCHANDVVPKPLPSIDSVRPRKNTITYNPYGLNSSAAPVVTDSIPNLSSPSSNYSHHSVSLKSVVNPNSISSIFSESSGEYILPLPIVDPNTYLPKKLHEYSVDLYDGYQLPDKFSSKNKKLGGGASSAVRTVVEKDDHSKVYALKKFQLFKKETTVEFYRRCSREFVIAVSLSNYHHIVDTGKLVKVPTIHDLTRGWGFILEYCPKGDLFDLVSKPSFKSVSHAEKYCLFKQVALGVKFMHDNDVAHRDIKPENVLISDSGELKLTDFGVSTAGHSTPGDFDSPIRLSTLYVGSPPYSSPEVMQFKHGSTPQHINIYSVHNSSSKYDSNIGYDPFKMDLWSLGVLLFVLLQQIPPFNEASKIDHFYRDYLASYASFTFEHPNFKTDNKHKGPLENYKLGRIFKDDGDASRVAWRLADPDCETRYTMAELFSDEWFLHLEMCCEERDEVILVKTLKEKGYDCGGLIRDHDEVLTRISEEKEREEHKKNGDNNSDSGTKGNSKDKDVNKNDKTMKNDDSKDNDAKKINKDNENSNISNNDNSNISKNDNNKSNAANNNYDSNNNDEDVNNDNNNNDNNNDNTKETSNGVASIDSAEKKPKEEPATASNATSNKDQDRKNDKAQKSSGNRLLLSNSVQHLNELEKAKQESALEDKLLIEQKRNAVLSFKKDIMIDRTRYCLGPIKKHHHV